MSLLAVRPILNALLLGLITLLCYFFLQLYRARMLLIKRKRLGLVRTPRPSFPNQPPINLHRLHSLVPPSTTSSSGLYLKKRMDALPQNAHYQYMFADIAREHFQSEGLFYIDLWPASGLMMIVTSPLVAAQAAQTNTKICYERASMLKRFFKPIAGGPNLFDMTEREWRPWRVVFSKGFSTEQVTGLVPHVLRETVVYKETLRNLARKKELFYLDLVTLRFMVDVMGQTILNASLRAQEGHNILADSMLSQIRWHQPNAEGNPLGHLNVVRWIVEWWNGQQMDRYIGRELDSRFSEYKSDMSDKRQKSVIDLVLQAYIGQSGECKPEKMDPEFRAFAIRQIRLFVFLGHDSTSSTLCYALHLLSQNPDTLKRIRSEYDRVLGKDVARAATLLEEQPKLLNELTYTTAVMKEVLRLFPPAATSRQGKPGTSLQDDLNAVCPTDDVMMIWTIHVELHRSPKYWKRPDEFLPERWLVGPTNELFPPNDAWRAFEHGPRNCIAQGIVMTELKIILACLVREFDFKPAYDDWDQLHPSKGSKIYRGDRAYQMEEAAAHPVEHYPCRVFLREN